MIEIDYDLIPLSEDKQQQIARDARLLASRGKVPPILASDYGRLVVVNPNQGFTIHHVPDELRKPLRRQLLPVYDGSNAVPGQALLEKILEHSEEPLRAVLIELHSPFPTAGELVARFPEVLARNPECRFLIHGDLNRVTSLLQQLMTAEQARCRLWFHACDTSIDLIGPDSLADMFVDLPKYPTLPAPFFESLRIKLGGKAEWFDLAGIKKLYRLFGVGNIGELDVSGKLRDRLITVDLPVGVIDAVRFRGGGADGFQGVRIEGARVPPARFQEPGLNGKPVPFAEIEAFFRRMPGREEEEIAAERIRAIRVNTFEGHVSFLWKPSPSYIPLYEVNALRWEPGADSPPVYFESVVVTEPSRPRFGDVRAGIRRLYLEKVYAESISKQVRLKEYASQLKIASLGPTSAQTFKLLKPLGLSRFLPTEKHYYLCDSTDQIPGYHQFEATLEASYAELLETLKSLFAEGADPAFDPDHIQHRLPIVTTWARGKAPPWASASAEHLNSVYNELRVFAKFSEVEFRRVAHPGMDYAGYFDKLNWCRRSGLLAKQLSNVKSGAYGMLFGPDESPDFVFFATEQDVARNRDQFYLPGLAWPEILKTAGAVGLTWDGDYAFTVFLDEQLAIIESLWRRDFDAHPGPQFYDDYFKSRIQECEKEIEELRHMSDPGAVRGSGPYQAAVKRIEAEHKAELAQFEGELASVAAKLQAVEEAYFAALGRFSTHLGTDFTPELLLSAESYMDALDDLIGKRSTEILVQLRDAIARTIRQVNRDLDQARETLKAYMAAHSRLHGAVVPFLLAQWRRLTREHAQERTEALVGKINDLQRLSAEQAAEAQKNLHERRVVLKEEQQRLEQELKQLSQKSRAEAERVRERVSQVLASISKGTKGDGKGTQLSLLRTLGDAIARANPELSEIIQSASDQQRVIADAGRLSFKRRLENTIALYETENELMALGSRQDQGMLQRMMAKRITAPLAPLQLPPPPGAEAELQAEFEEAAAGWETQGQRLKQVGEMEKYLQDVHKPIADFQALQKASVTFKSAVDEKARHQRGVEAIQKHVARLRTEARDLPRLIDERLLPAFRVLCDQYLVPGTATRMEEYRLAQGFVRETGKLSFENVQREFLDHAVFRRFQAAQFRSGAVYGQDAGHALFAHLSNVLPALYGFHRQLRVNLRRLGFRDDDITLIKLQVASAFEIRHFCERQKNEEPHRRLTYLVLPGTMSLTEALDIIEFKDKLFEGLPQLVLLFISKFDAELVRRDAALRDRYFRAVKHNVIVNIGAAGVVDNPGPLSVRLAQETIGRAFDLAKLDLMPDQDTHLKPA